MRLDRLLGIALELMGKRRVTARELAARFEVSVRTVYRDVELINQAGIPVVSFTGVNGGFDPDHAAQKLPNGVEIISGNLMQPETLSEALQGAESMFLLISSDEPGIELNTDPQVVTLAKAAGIKCVVVLVGYEEGPVEETLRASGMQWTLVKPAEFMANALADWRDSIRSEGVVREFYGKALSAKVHEGDIAAVAVEALLEDGHHAQSYLLTGPEAITRKDAVSAISKAIGKEIPFLELTENEARRQWEDQGYDEESIEFFVRMAKNPPKAGYTVLPSIEQVLGRPARTFAEWAKENRTEFQ